MVSTDGSLSLNDLPPIPTFIYFWSKTTTMSDQTGRAGIGDFTKAETMHMLGIIREVSPIGSEAWKAVVEGHSEKHPGRCKNALMRKCCTLGQKQCLTGDPNMPEDVRLAKRIKFEIGNKASIGDAEEEFILEDVAFG